MPNKSDNTLRAAQLRAEMKQLRDSIKHDVDLLVGNASTIHRINERIQANPLWKVGRSVIRRLARPNPSETNTLQLNSGPNGSELIIEHKSTQASAESTTAHTIQATAAGVIRKGFSFLKRRAGKIIDKLSEHNAND